MRLGALIKERILKDDLDALNLIIQRAKDLRVMVIIPGPAAETENIRSLLEAGFALLTRPKSLGCETAKSYEGL